jgi:acetyl esterase/lipase
VPDGPSDGVPKAAVGESKSPKSEHVSSKPKVVDAAKVPQHSAPPSSGAKLDSAEPAVTPGGDAERGDAKPQASGDTNVTTLATPEPAAVEDLAVVAAPAPPPGPTNAVEVVASAVSTFVGSLLTPFAAGATPEAPATQPQLWTLLAFARRELETAFTPPSSAQGRGGDVTVGEALTGAAPEAAQAQLAAAAQVTPVANSLTYTAPPNIIDQVTVLGLRVLRAVSSVIGVDLFAQINKLLITNSPPFFLTFGLNAHQREVELTDGTTWKVWEFQPPEPTDKTVIAIHGSGFIYQPNLMQWYDYTSMARDTGATVLVPIYPLATTEAGSALNVVPDMADFISSQVDLRGADNVSVYGDSAGSIIAIAAVRQLVIAGKPVPSSMVLLSLTPDGSLSNPDIKNTDDPVVDVDHLGDYATSHWGDGLADPGTDPRYNALSFETLVGLPPTTIYVGSTEFVLPDTLLLYQKAVEEGAPISVVIGQGQIHDWALGGLPINSAAPGVRRDVYRQLGLV